MNQPPTEMTVAEARRRAKKILGRLPKCGYEVMVDDQPHVKTYLVHEAIGL